MGMMEGSKTQRGGVGTALALFAIVTFFNPRAFGQEQRNGSQTARPESFSPSRDAQVRVLFATAAATQEHVTPGQSAAASDSIAHQKNVQFAPTKADNNPAPGTAPAGMADARPIH